MAGHTLDEALRLVIEAEDDDAIKRALDDVADRKDDPATRRLPRPPMATGEETAMYDQERFEVIRHHDAKGAWYRVIDKQSNNATIRAFRGQKPAHRFCREANAGARKVQASGVRTEGRQVTI